MKNLRLTYRDRARIKMSLFCIKLNKELKSKLFKMTRDEIIKFMPDMYSEYSLKYSEDYAEQQYDLIWKILNILICLCDSEYNSTTKTLKESLVFV